MVDGDVGGAELAVLERALAVGGELAERVHDEELEAGVVVGAVASLPHHVAVLVGDHDVRHASDVERLHRRHLAVLYNIQKKLS